MKTTIHNALIVPMTSEGLFFRGDIGIDGSKISFIGDAPKDFRSDRFIDATNCVAMPALVNAHTHLSMGLMRNYKDNLPNLQQWLGEIFPIEDKLIPEDVLIASRLGVAELVQSGVTTFADMYFHTEATAQAVLDSGIRANLGLTLFGDLESSTQRVQEKDKLLFRFMERSEGRIQIDIAPHAIYTTTKESYKFGADWARERKVRMHTHLAETRQEVEDCIQTNGLTPLQYLHSLGILETIPSYLAHCVHLNADDIQLMKDLPSSIIHNPTSNCKLASGIAPIATYKAAGLNVALGTDGSSSNNNQNMMEEMHISSLLTKVLGTEAAALQPYDILQMATINGARALGLEQKIGTLEAGKEADLLLLDLSKSHLTPLNNPFSALVYAAQASDIQSVFCQGKALMQDRKIEFSDLNTIIEETNKCWKSVLSR